MNVEPTTQAGILTEDLASPLHVKPESIRSRYCREGHYYGLRPRKLPNGRLLWPADSIDRLLGEKEEA